MRTLLAALLAWAVLVIVFAVAAYVVVVGVAAIDDWLSAVLP